MKSVIALLFIASIAITYGQDDFAGEEEREEGREGERERGGAGRMIMGCSR